MPGHVTHVPQIRLHFHIIFRHKTRLIVELCFEPVSVFGETDNFQNISLAEGELVLRRSVVRELGDAFHWRYSSEEDLEVIYALVGICLKV